MKPDPLTTFDAWLVAAAREEMPTGLSTAELRELGAGVLARSVYTARGTNVIYASKLKKVIELLAAGDIGESDARLALSKTLRAVGYTPEGGFPESPESRDKNPEKVPPAVAGSIEDLMSFRRLDLIVRTQIDLMTGAGLQYRGMQPDELAEFPAWELVRVMPVSHPRDWPARWAIAGGTSNIERPTSNVEGKRMIALKGDPVWGELGSYENFPDALGVDYPPFYFNSGMGWQPVSRRDCLALGITGPGGETIDEYHAGATRPRVMAGELPLPSPRLTPGDIDPELLEKFKAETHAEPVPEKPGAYKYADLLELELKAAREAYEKQS